VNLPTPYLVFLGDAEDYKQAKVACGLVEWRPELCVGQMRMPDCKVDLGLPERGFAEAQSLGVKTFVIGISPFTRELPDSYCDIIVTAMEHGFNIANPLHAKLPEDLQYQAYVNGVEIFNFRHRDMVYPKGTGEKRTGLRLLTVGTDCACGKKFTALTIHRALQQAEAKTTFRSTGQTGFLISNSGINNDTIQADFLSGAAEWLSPDNEPDHWDIVEGQGALSHPSFGAGSLSLIHGTQPDVIIMCHEPGRKTHRGVEKALPEISGEIALVLTLARRNNPNVRLGGISLFTRDFEDKDRLGNYMDRLREHFKVPVFDPNDVEYEWVEGKGTVLPEHSTVKDFAALMNSLLRQARGAKDGS
jgi:uncharacterized NAD-dependent epimerase/dehydratase family protein